MSEFDLVLRNGIIHGQKLSIGIKDGRIAALAPALQVAALEIELGGHLVLPGFVDSHIHLDKACLLDRCGHVGGDLQSAIYTVSDMKKGFTVEDIYARGSRVIEMAITNGTTHMRTHVELDSRIGLRGFEAVTALRKDYAWALDLSICVFPQEGMTQEPETEGLLRAALEQGADVLGGCPYTDKSPTRQITGLFWLAKHFDVDLDFHLDFDLDTSWRHLDLVCRQALAMNFEGRVTVGHVTKLSALTPEKFEEAAEMLVDAGVAVTVLPATDLYLMGRQLTSNVPRGLTPAHKLLEHGVTCSIATNNVLNPFTPFGDASLLRMANLYAVAAQVRPEDFADCVDMVTTLPARMLKLKDYGLSVGDKADLVVLDATTEVDALARPAQTLMGFKNGRQSFRRELVNLCRP
jgi:cytosine/creatinine deaminase